MEDQQANANEEEGNVEAKQHEKNCLKATSRRGTDNTLNNKTKGDTYNTTHVGNTPISKGNVTNFLTGNGDEKDEESSINQQNEE
ncbi:hypothetical protein H5410_027252 [Solanum commersonii]|uniref:Uncharacterized protein n=1 Tax=Solanum commersonii TaxID=4109 RepID=A0A9J5Z1B2_SOLCO|nr:hypothetical protein H5410_027252 [Solanum commersonii]